MPAVHPSRARWAQRAAEGDKINLRNLKLSLPTHLKALCLAVGNIEELHHILTSPFCQGGATTNLSQTRQRCSEHLRATRLLCRLIGSVLVLILLRLGALVHNGSLLVLLLSLVLIILIVLISLGRCTADQRKRQERHQKQHEDAA